jgi:hypothetical protein
VSLAKPLALLMLSCALVSGAQAQVYKCKRGNVIAYQDKPCPRGTELGRITLEAPPVPGRTQSSTISPPKPAADRGPAAPPAPATLPPSENYKCMRSDGSSYFSASLMPKRSLVSASTLPKPPAGVKANEQVWVTDSCVATPLKEACDFYATEIDRVEKKARSASTAEQKALAREAMRLRTISNSRCRR